MRRSATVGVADASDEELAVPSNKSPASSLELIPKDSPEGGEDGGEPILYGQRWVQLGLLALLALVSDLTCFSVAAVPSTFSDTFGHNPNELVDYFLLTNVLGCFLVPDILRIFGLRKAVTGASALMAAGCLLKAGLPMAGSLPSYEFQLAGTILVGAAQPLFQCTPPLLSATWFGSKERALATAVAINFNQVGIGSAFLLGGALGTSAAGLNTYFGLIAVASVALCAATVLKFEERPLTPPSASAAAAIAEQLAGAAQGPGLTFPGKAVRASCASHSIGGLRVPSSGGVLWSRPCAPPQHHCGLWRDLSQFNCPHRSQLRRTPCLHVDPRRHRPHAVRALPEAGLPPPAGGLCDLHRRDQRRVSFH